MKKKLPPGTLVARETAVKWSSFARAPEDVEYVTAAEFKTHCLRLIEEVRQGHGEVVITRYGTPVAKLVPYVEDPVSIFGFMRGSVVSHGDLIAPIDEAWEADA